jgi:hypothetical protein
MSVGRRPVALLVADERVCCRAERETCFAVEMRIWLPSPSGLDQLSGQKPGAVCLFGG